MRVSGSCPYSERPNEQIFANLMTFHIALVGVDSIHSVLSGTRPTTYLEHYMRIKSRRLATASLFCVTCISVLFAAEHGSSMCRIKASTRSCQPSGFGCDVLPFQ